MYILILYMAKYLYVYIKYYYLTKILDFYYLLLLAKQLPVLKFYGVIKIMPEYPKKYSYRFL